MTQAPAYPILVDLSLNQTSYFFNINMASSTLRKFELNKNLGVAYFPFLQPDINIQY